MILLSLQAANLIKIESEFALADNTFNHTLLLNLVFEDFQTICEHSVLVLLDGLVSGMVGQSEQIQIGLILDSLEKPLGTQQLP